MKSEKIVCVIPARFDSERLPGKVLYPLNGKSVLERVYNRARLVKSFSDIYIATDSSKVAGVAEGFGAKVIMTQGRCRSGSDRVAEAAKTLDATIFVNIQADEPYLPVQAVEKPLHMMTADPSIPVATAATRIRKKDELYDTNIVKIVMDKNGKTLYSSRALIPHPEIYFCRDNLPYLKKVIFYKHIGVYLFRKEFLKTFAALPLSFLERIEKLEHLRIIENGYPLAAAIISRDSPCVDSLQDIKKLTAE